MPEIRMVRLEPGDDEDAEWVRTNFTLVPVTPQPCDSRCTPKLFLWIGRDLYVCRIHGGLYQQRPSDA